MNIILITDIYGLKESQWLDKYINIFQMKEHDITIYDSLEIGKIDKSISEIKLIHEQFISIGIKNAVNFLLEKKHESSIYIGFSIGGFIAWEAISNGLNALALYCISSTRLRYKSEPLGIPSKLIYGDLDINKPNITCLKRIETDYDIFLNSEHNLYNIHSNIQMLILDFYHFIDKIIFHQLVHLSFKDLNVLCHNLALIEFRKNIKYRISDKMLKIEGNINRLSNEEKNYIVNNEKTINWILNNKIEISGFINKLEIKQKK